MLTRLAILMTLLLAVACTTEDNPLPGDGDGDGDTDADGDSDGDSDGGGDAGGDGAVACDEGVWSGSYTISDSASMAALEGYVGIRGDLTIDAPDVTELSGLGCLESIEGALVIGESAALVDFSGLGSLTTLAYQIYVDGGNSLTSLSGLSSLTQAPGLTIQNNTSLTSLSGLEALTRLDYLDIQSCSALTEISGLNWLEEALVRIEMNESLTTVELSSLTTAMPELNISGNGALTSLDLGSLTTSEYVYFQDNDALTTLEALASLTTAEALLIRDNDSLEHLGLSSLTHVEGQVDISYNPALPTCEAESLVAQLDTAPGMVDIGENDDSGTCE